MLVAGDNSNSAYSLAIILLHLGAADLVIPYLSNPYDRKMGRRILSSLYTAILNIIFGFRLKYYNGLNIFPTDLAKKTVASDSFSFNAEMVIQLLKSGHSYIQVPQETMESAPSSALQYKNMMKTLISIWRFYRKMHLHHPMKPITCDPAASEIPFK